MEQAGDSRPGNASLISGRRLWKSNVRAAPLLALHLISTRYCLLHTQPRLAISPDKQPKRTTPSIRVEFQDTPTRLPSPTTHPLPLKNPRPPNTPNTAPPYDLSHLAGHAAKRDTDANPAQRHHSPSSFAVQRIWPGTINRHHWTSVPTLPHSQFVCSCSSSSMYNIPRRKKNAYAGT